MNVVNKFSQDITSDKISKNGESRRPSIFDCDNFNDFQLEDASSKKNNSISLLEGWKTQPTFDLTAQTAGYNKLTNKSINNGKSNEKKRYGKHDDLYKLKSSRSHRHFKEQKNLYGAPANTNINIREMEFNMGVKEQQLSEKNYIQDVSKSTRPIMTVKIFF